MSVSETNCTIQWIVIYPVDRVIHHLNNWGQKTILNLVLVVQTLDSAIHRINRYPEDKY